MYSGTSRFSIEDTGSTPNAMLHIITCQDTFMMVPLVTSLRVLDRVYVYWYEDRTLIMRVHPDTQLL